jgi:stearoyl-CoA desaturase (Delta-9 desaturase)
MHLLWILLVTLAFVQLSVFLTTIYLHRTITHRSLELHPVVANLMHVEIALFTGIQPRQWAAVHRKHHHFSDKEGDPHSPKLFGLWHVLLGNFFYYKKEARNPATIEKYTPDYRPDLIDRIPLIRFGVFGSLAIFCAMFGWLGVAAWLFHIVAYVLLNSAINSLGHEVGYKNYDNGATNLQLLALLTGGEGLHNNHHESPASPRFAHVAGEIDPAWLIIRFLKICGVAKVKVDRANTAAA